MRGKTAMSSYVAMLLVLLPAAGGTPGSGDAYGRRRDLEPRSAPMGLRMSEEEANFGNYSRGLAGR